MHFSDLQASGMLEKYTFDSALSFPSMYFFNDSSELTSVEVIIEVINYKECDSIFQSINFTTSVRRER